MKTIIGAAIIAAALLSCEKTEYKMDLPPQGIKVLNLSEKTTDVIQADNDFGLALFRYTVEGNDADNVLISPTSVALALAMTYNGAAGETKTALEVALRKQGFTPEEINQSYKSLVEALTQVDPKVQLQIANSIWYKKGFTVLPQFIQVNRDYYNAEVNALNFDNPAATEEINNWVDEKTNHKIEKIIDDIPEEVVMYLINAMYFKGDWQYAFDKNATFYGPFFTGDDSQVSVPFMKQQGDYSYMACDTFALVELPYGRGNFCMNILLPQPGYSLSDLLPALTAENWDGWLKRRHFATLNLVLPKFTFSYKNILNNELSAMGMGIAFTPQADFSGINGTGGLDISKVIHKAFVDVNEEGTTAAAVTAVEIELTAMPGEPITFRADQPFIFAIREVTTGAVLFIGMVQNPLTKENE
ncbi:MAG: serpin family protein [Bacteroidales bacterium]|nr:serpin family protein [Bacteroidales bacterium]